MKGSVKMDDNTFGIILKLKYKISDLDKQLISNAIKNAVVEMGYDVISATIQQSSYEVDLSTEKNMYKSKDSNISMIYNSSLPNTLCDLMIEIFKGYRKEDESRMADIIGVGHDELSYLLHKRHVSLDNFLVICDYLKPSELLKNDWKYRYVER